MGILLALLIAASSVNTSGGPPPAFVVVDGVTQELAIGSYCWADQCVDVAAMPPGPTIDLSPGEIVTFRLAFDPGQVRLYTGASTDRGTRLLPGRELHYEATGSERYISLFVRPHEGGDVTYAATAR